MVTQACFFSKPAQVLPIILFFIKFLGETSYERVNILFGTNDSVLTQYSADTLAQFLTLLRGEKNRRRSAYKRTA